ncbi:hypothetical protein LK12_19265 [Novosphingobium malaysiense]|uniref:Asl1-like glycosyl hydrolase catalytic domain-containing protein n=2 Tax=Novosphingobium malaysiense TaxID=1348853 RepID=A0A0B1ZLG2_9SPHN|nr:hypothetical protein LK12_19265 [Novosphingobium malaysiense]
MAALTNAACEEIRSIDPNVSIISPSITLGGIDFFRHYFQSVDKSCIDIVSIHYYINNNNNKDGFDKPSIRFLKRVKELMRKVGLSDRPIWNTEFGVACSAGKNGCMSPSTEQIEAGRLSLFRYLFIMAAENVQSASYYFWERRPPATPFAMTRDHRLRLSKNAAIYKKIMNMLQEAVITQAYEKNGVYVVCIQKRTKRYAAIWSGSSNASLSIPEKWNYHSYINLLDGNSLIPSHSSLEIPGNSLVIAQN